MHQLPVVDAHVHFWDLDRLSYPWLTPPFDDSGVSGSVETIARTYLPADYRADAGRWNVVAAVHVDAGAAAHHAIDETEWLEGLAAADPLVAAIIGFAALDDPGVEAVLAAHDAHPHVRGIRHIANWHPDPALSYTPRDLLDDPAWARGFALLGKYGLSFDLQAYPGQLAAAAAIARRHPNVPVMLNHCGMPLLREPDGKARWTAGMKALAELPQVGVKISGFGIVDHDWTVDSIRPLVLETIEMFGTDRCMFASDFPTDKLYAGFDTVFGAYDAIVADFSDHERRALFGTNAARLYRLDINLGGTDDA